MATRLAALLPALQLAAGPAAAAVPAEAFGTLPQMSDVTLSPDGALLAWHDESSAEPRAVIYDVAAGRNRRVLRIDPEAKLRALGFADDTTLLMTVSFTTTDEQPGGPSRFEYFRTLASDVNSGESRQLLMEGGRRELVSSADLIAWHTSKPHTVIMSSFDYSERFSRATGSRIADTRAQSPWVMNLFDVDTRTGKGTVIGEGDPFVRQWVVDPDGAPAARSEWHQDGEVYELFARDGSRWRRILHLEHRGAPTLHEVSPDGKTVIAIGAGEDGRDRLWSIPLDGSAPRDLLPDITDNVVGFVYDPLTGATVGAQVGGLIESTRWIDGQAERRFKEVAKAFPERDVALIGRSQSGTRVVAYVEGPSHPPVYYLVDFTTHRADVIGEAYPGLANVTLGAVRAFSYRARDGTTIPAYLTLPPGALPKQLPLVVMPHDGPGARDYYVFDWWTQFLAARGYAVLQPQFRGSSGFGDAFQRAGERQWGGLMQDDVSDGVKELISAGVADPHRVCIVGAGYGGYAALAGAAFTPELYACAASIGGVSDLADMEAYLEGHGGNESDAVLAWREQIGGSSDPKVGAHSPAHAAASVRAPILLLHCADDTVVPPSQAEEMARALRRAGKKVSYVKLPGDDHWLSRSATRVRMLQELDAFLAQYLR
ncbi:MAG TPA: prolyl oligopeptidase family serine peptidase [Steroidobacteraceae bacterium]|nr:prolyl oligopeptidase family serine peptidase [Steroidobacteraceae bacterium]